MRLKLPLVLLCFAVVEALAFCTAASALNLRIVTYNINADTDGYTAARPGLDTVLEAIGQQNTAGNVQPADVIGLEETTSNVQTVAPLAATLNACYGVDRYGYSDFQATEVSNSPASGNGPNSMLYNKETLVLLESVGVGTPLGSSNGLSRQIARYKFQPVDGTPDQAFYLYISHMKANTTDSASVAARHAKEVQILRDDSATLPAGAFVFYTGDFNMVGSTEAAYQALTADGPAQGLDPLNNNPQDNTITWDTAAYVPIATESGGDLEYRDDIIFMTPNVYYGTVQNGLRLVTGSYHTFGNNGTVRLNGSVNSTSNTALDDLTGPITPAAARAALVTASDHLPVVADFTYDPVTFPTITGPASVTADAGTAFSYRIIASPAVYAYAASGLPQGLAVNTATGLISGIPTETGTFTIPLQATNIAGTANGTLTLVLNAPPLPVITSATNVAANVGTAFSYRITATPATSVYTYAASGLPQGLAVNPSTGVISGTPTEAGTFTIPLQATNSAGTGNGTLTLVLTAVPPPVISGSLSMTARQGVQFVYRIAASNNPTSYAATNLPGGVGINTQHGEISGYPSVYGTFSIPISASNVGGTGNATLTLVILPIAPVITSDLNPPARQGVVFAYRVTGSNNPTKYGASGLPAGLKFDQTTGLVSGTPTVYGTFTPLIAAFNDGGYGSARLNLVVKQAVPVITGDLNPPSREGVAFAYQITATNSPTKYGASGLPAGLSISQSTGKIIGHPAKAGTYTVTIAAFNDGGYGVAKMNLVVKPPLGVASVAVGE